MPHTFHFQSKSMVITEVMPSEATNGIMLHFLIDPRSMRVHHTINLVKYVLGICDSGAHNEPEP